MEDTNMSPHHQIHHQWMLRQIQLFELEGTILSDSAVNDLRACKCILAMEIDSPIICQITSEEFKAVKSIILGAHSTIWVTKGGGEVDCQMPELAMITGLARSIRGELLEVQLVTLDLDLSPPSSSALQTETVYNMTLM